MNVRYAFVLILGFALSFALPLFGQIDEKSAAAAAATGTEIPAAMAPEQALQEASNSTLKAPGLKIGTSSFTTQASTLWQSPAMSLTTGYVKLITPIVHNESNMFTIRIQAFLYSPGGDSVDIRCSGYADSGSTLINQSCHVEGTPQPVEIATETRPGATVPVVVIRIGTPSTAWYYPQFTAEYTGWQAKSSADFQWVIETTPTPGPNMNSVVENDRTGTLILKATDGNTAATRLTVEGGGTFQGGGTFSGWLGAGTSSPLAPLHVRGPASQSQLYVTNNTLNTGVLSALSNADDNVMLGFDVDFVGGAWKARSVTLAALYKQSGHFRILGSGNNVVNSTIGGAAFNIYQDVDLTTGVTTFNSPTVPNTSTAIAGGNVTASNSMTVGPAGGPPATSRLVVNGSAQFNGTVTGNNIKAHYQDVAEWVPAVADLSPGTVVVIDKRSGNMVRASAASYDTSVAGVVSAQPGIILGEEGASKEQIATTGRVRVRVDASKGAVAIGDLLVTSDVSGTAMKSSPLDIGGISIHRPGTIIGKALEPLERGVGEILVLLSLQ